MGAFGNGERVTLRRALVFCVPAGDQLPDVHEILEDHLVEPSELTSDRPVEVPAASIEQGPYWDMNRCGRPRPRSAVCKIRLSCLHRLQLSRSSSTESANPDEILRFVEMLARSHARARSGSETHDRAEQEGGVLTGKF